MAAADIVTLPSYFEGCPNVVIEALAAGRPVVATNIGGIAELMDETCGRMVPVRDVSALTQALDEGLNETWDPDSIASKHSRGWSDVADDLYQVLEETIECSRFSNGH
jgi:glycosyltransferase involved in cell wall biosynthesis